ncbi:MAG: pseudouridine synthase [Christensenellales bacterium]
MPNPKKNGCRLNKYIADSGFCSRRDADIYIAAGKVTIDGRIGVLGDIVSEEMRVMVDGKTVVPETQYAYIALNKPRGIVCTADPREPYNVVDYISHEKRIYPVGRLDKDSSGLLLLTSDGSVVNKILRAAGGHEKEYIVSVDKPVTQAFLRQMRRGVPILDTVTLPCICEKISERQFRIILIQGLNRQIRRMCEYLGYRVTSLTRIRIMHIVLGNLKPGHWRNLTEEEVQILLATEERRPSWKTEEGGMDE